MIFCIFSAKNKFSTSKQRHFSKTIRLNNDYPTPPKKIYIYVYIIKDTRPSKAPKEEGICRARIKCVIQCIMKNEECIMYNVWALGGMA